MAEFPAMPFWTDSHLADTTHLNDAEHGLYVRMLIHMWRMPKRKFPNDDEWLARKLGKTMDEVSGKVRPLIKEFFKTDGNWILHSRLEKEFLFVSAQSQKQSDRAKSRWNKQNGPCRGSTTSGIAPTPTPTPHKKERIQSYPQEEVARCTTCGGVYPDPATGRLSGCVCSPDPNWKPKPLPPGQAAIRTNAMPDEPTTSPPPPQAPPADQDEMEFDLGQLVGSIGKKPNTTKPSGRGNGASPHEPLKVKPSWRRKPDGSFERT